jgi:hypothetical protein
LTEHHYCSCGFAAASVGELIDHLHEVFSLASDTAPDGSQHAEAARDEPASDDALIACLCGYPALSLDNLDRHILAAYTSSDATAPDGISHVPESADLDRFLRQ